jgi:hypothetical protein
MKKNKFLWLFTFLVFALAACKTEDVKPIINTNNTAKVKLVVSATNIAEAGGLSQITVTLNEQASNDVTVFFKYSGKALLNVDFSAPLSITMKAGSLTNQSTLLTIQDILVEGNENLIIDIDSVAGGLEDGVQTKTILIEDDDSPVVTGNLIINEVLYDPSNSGLDGDANGDGVYSQAEDEFIEFYNNSSKALDISGYKIFDATALSSNTPRHIVPAGTIIPANKAFVVFGGGTPTGTFGGAIVQKSTTGDFNMNNAGDLVTVQDSTGAILLTFDVTPLSDNPNESYTRNPDITGDFVQHSTIDPDKFKFSPGTTVERKPF